MQGAMILAIESAPLAIAFGISLAVNFALLVSIALVAMVFANR